MLHAQGMVMMSVWRMTSLFTTLREAPALPGRVLHQAEGDREGAAPSCPGRDQAGSTKAVGHGGPGNHQHDQRHRPRRQSAPPPRRPL